jgi:hypothetical protein
MTGGGFTDCRSSRLGFVNISVSVGTTKEANLPATRQSAIEYGAGSVGDQSRPTRDPPRQAALARGEFPETSPQPPSFFEI